MRMRVVPPAMPNPVAMRVAMMIAAARIRSQAVAMFTMRPPAAIKIASSKWIVTGEKRRTAAS